jgi:hypothetical protein
MPRRVNVLRLQLFTCLIKPFEIRVLRLFIDNIYKRVIMRIILYNVKPFCTSALFHAES